MPERAVPVPAEPVQETIVSSPAEEEAVPQSAAQQTVEPVCQTPWRVVGEVLRTYIICEDDQENVWLIDKHAAHERVRFDALKNHTQPVMSQQLLSPLAVELSAEDAASLLEQLPLLEEFIDVVLEGGCTQLWIDVKTLGDEAGGNAEASRTGIAAAQIVHEKRAKNFVGFIVGRLAIRDKVIPAVRSAWPVSYGAAAYEPGDFIARDIPWANMKLADFGLDTKRAKSFPENKVRLSLWQIDTDEQMQWYQGIRSDVYGITNYPLRMMDKLGLR